MMRWRVHAWLAVWLVLTAGCTSVPTPAERRIYADTLAQAHGWQRSVISTTEFDVVAYMPARINAALHLTVYIEGDGFAWVSGSQPSDDPTPRDPLGLRLALAQPNGNAGYLARPCQFVVSSRCAQRYWTTQRFAPEVVNASDQSLDALKSRFGAQRITLVGYSGGAAVAALLAQRRNDVVRLVTVAGNLDHRAWTAYHHVMPLTGSLNPADAASQFFNLPQVHWVGNDDMVVTPALARAWPLGFAGQNDANVRVVPGFDHYCCWAQKWPQLWSAAQ